MAIARMGTMTKTTPSHPTIALDAVSIHYRGHAALANASIQFSAGQSWAILGENGAGKSTLIKAAMQLKTCDAGSVHWHNLQRQDIAYLPQQAEIDRNLPITVFELAALGLWSKLRWWRRLNAEDSQQVYAALEQVGMEHAANKHIGALSSGQFQRVLFARLLLQQAKMLLLDEPFSALDSHTTNSLIQVLVSCMQQGAGVVAVLHNRDQARAYFSNSLLLSTQIIAQGATDTVLSIPCPSCTNT